MNRRYSAVICLAVTLLAPPIARAQSILANFGSDIKFGTFDILNVWASPFRGSWRDYGTAALGLGVVGLSAFADGSVASWVRDNPNSGAMKVIKPFGEERLSLANIGAGTWHTEGSVAVYAVGLVTGSRPIRDIGMGCLASEEGHSIFRQGVEAVFSRERPLFQETVNGQVVDRPGRPYTLITPAKKNWFDNSFFSGHVTSIASCTSFITHRFHLGLAEPVLWTFASVVSLTRIADQRHYLSDVLLGGLLGYAVGKVVGDRSREREEKRTSDKADKAKTQPDSANGRSWLNGLYVSQSGSATLLGWRSVR